MSFLTAVRAIELVVLSAVLFYSVLKIRGAVSSSSFSSSYDLLLSGLKKPVSIFKSWCSSLLYIFIIMNFTVILIVVSSLFHHPKVGSDGGFGVEDDGGGDSQDGYDLHSAFSPPPAPPPMQGNRKRHPRERKPKDIPVAATKASDFSGLTKEEDIKKEKATIDEGEKIRDIHVAEETEHYYVEEIYADLLRLGEPKEIKMVVHSVLESSKEAKPIQNPMEETAAKHVTKNQDCDEDDDTMEATWMAINGGTKPQEKQLKKSETWPQPRKFALAPEESDSESEELAMAQKKELRKSMTFNDTVTIRCRGGLRRDPSMNLEELNHRFEAFIQKINHEMRLQRQESAQRYFDMIGRDRGP